MGPGVHPEGQSAIVSVHESVLDAVGDTPLFRLNRITEGLPAAVYVKVEFANPGGSVKDRAALAMVREAERLGDLRPGGVIVEGTSGNTGVGLAMVAAQHGYRTIVVVPDTIAREKVALLRAYGAQVVQTTGKVPRDHPDHVNNMARRIAAETPGGWHANQYDNPANPRIHELTTGPEIWEQTGGRVTHLVAGVGTGGTISGTGRYLKQHGVTVIGADPATSVYSGGDGSPYFVESIGHYLHPATPVDVWPNAYDQGVVDRFERIPDRESLLVTRRLAREEGLLVGGSAGTAVAAALRVAAELGPETRGRRDPARLRTQLPVQVLRRRLDDTPRASSTPRRARSCATSCRSAAWPSRTPGTPSLPSSMRTPRGSWPSSLRASPTRRRALRRRCSVWSSPPTCARSWPPILPAPATTWPHTQDPHPPRSAPVRTSRRPGHGWTVTARYWCSSTAVRSRWSRGA